MQRPFGHGRGESRRIRGWREGRGSRWDVGSGRWRRRRGFGDPFTFLVLGTGSALRGVRLADGEMGRTEAKLGAAVVVNPFYRPHDAFLSVFKSNLVKQLDGGEMRPDFGFQNVLFCFARASPVGAFLTITPHFSIASLNRTSPFTGPLRPPFLHPPPRSSLSPNTTPLSEVSRSAPSSFRSMLVRKL